MKPLNVQRTKVTLYPDSRRVLMRPFHLMSGQRASEICARIMALSEDEVHTQLAQLWAEFGGRHKNIRDFFRRRFEEVRPYLLNDRALSEERLLLVGGYFTDEYSFEAAALFNPSIVPHPDQTCLPPGSLRFVLSLRATGEGHISSVTFRTGVLDARGNIQIDLPTPYALEPAQMPQASFRKDLFARKLDELTAAGAFSREVLKGLGESFTLEDVRASVSQAVKQFQVRDLETENVARRTLDVGASEFRGPIHLGLGFFRTRAVSLNAGAEPRNRGCSLCSFSG